ncbi:MAG: phenylalanine--tRNA ligase subunit alpha, partial [Candidatus Omnitrophica bacterium]|nr:phenylalanine--tRNA ligase subunit alpha [Candidatus Omnitrophota bacterium]
MREKILQIEQEALNEIASSSGDKTALEALRIKYLGRKGIVAELFKKMGALPAGERPEAGQLINALKNSLTKALDEKLISASGVEEAKDRIDITLPGVSQRLGRLHPITKTIQEICDIFISLGFRVVEGPEIETEHYNFETLNIPLEHPSRDAFDTFYLRTDELTEKPKNGKTEKLLLRSHTSPVQTRFM